MTEKKERPPSVLLIDPLEFRRLALASLVATEERDGAMHVEPVGPDVLEDPATLERLEAQVGLVVLSPGALPLGGAEVRRWVSLVRAGLSDRPLVLFSDRDGAEEALAAIRFGAQGLVPLGLPPAVVHHALVFIRDGGTYFPPEALLDISPDPASGRAGWEGASHRGLTLRQIEVLDLLRLGSSNKVIARRLDMQESTVKVHVRHILRKLGAANRTQAALIAAELMKADGDEALALHPGAGATEDAATPCAMPPSPRPMPQGHGLAGPGHALHAKH